MEESSEESIEKPHIISSFSEIEENYNLINKIVEFEFGEV